ncbi:MAG: AMIN domain-containing protein [Alphaproteobacteria bacterium]|nr:AMIN domain-containing protein [Alphaproteobacteria bacterium]
MIRLILIILGLAVGLEPSLAAGIQVHAVRVGDDSSRTRLVVELSQKVKYTIFALDNPRRIVINLPPVQFPENVPAVSGMVKAMRFGQFSVTQSRVVVDLGAPAKVERNFILPPASGFPHRLVIDLVRTDAARFTEQVAAYRSAKLKTATAARPKPTPITPKAKKSDSKPTIVIDAGHGGVDPGALGRKTKEKSVTLSFARELAKQLKATGRYRVYLTRSRDIYIPLRRRVAIARERGASLFISIHADALARKKVRGLSIYTLSENASDKEAAALARKENQSDIVAGVDFEEYPEAADTLLALAQRETKNLSVRFASMVTKRANKQTRLLERPHRFAGFRVLKAPDVPSVLIELGFLTNRQDEKQLRAASWRKKVASALRIAIDDYFKAIPISF